MSLQNKNCIAYLTSLSLLFSYAEFFLPRFAFFKLGLSNIVILSSLNLNFSSFMILCFLKSLTSSFLSGTLFSPFFLISLGQSIFSGLLMFALNLIFKKRKFVSIYGISVLGSTFSALVQIFLASLYLGFGTFSLLGYLLIFSVFTGIFTAYFCIKLNLEFYVENKKNLSTPENFNFDFKSEKICQPKPVAALRQAQYPRSRSIDSGSVNLQILNQVQNDINSQKSRKSKLKSIILILLILIFSLVIFMIQNIYILLGCFLVSLILQIIFGRKILILPHIFTWIFVIISCLLIPSGKNLFKILNFPITQGALFIGIKKSLQLSASMALSQCAAKIDFESNNLLGLTFFYFKNFCETFKNINGNVWKKLKLTLEKI